MNSMGKKHKALGKATGRALSLSCLFAAYFIYHVIKGVVYMPFQDWMDKDPDNADHVKYVLVSLGSLVACALCWRPLCKLRRKALALRK
eukprot:SAG11_NODE_1715_length_4396_cov_3.282290_4_plen_89_part_00